MLPLRLRIHGLVSLRTGRPLLRVCFEESFQGADPVVRRASLLFHAAVVGGKQTRRLFHSNSRDQTTASGRDGCTGGRTGVANRREHGEPPTDRRAAYWPAEQRSRIR